MTDAGDANDDGQRGPVTLDLTADRAYSEEADPAKALDAFELADVADDLREQ